MEKPRPSIRVRHETAERPRPETVRKLSLGALSEQYGTTGLYVRLNDALEQAELSDNILIRETTQLGLALHIDDMRTNGRYNDHLMRVTIRMLEDFGIRDPNLIAAGPLHDTLEDHPRDLVHSLTGDRIKDPAYARLLGKKALSLITNDEVVQIISDVTNPIVLPGEDKLESYTQHTKHLIQTSPKGRVLKLSDFIDNAVGNHATIGNLQLKLDKKYIAQYDLHKNGLFLEDSLITGERREKALALLNKGHQRALGRLALHAPQEQ
jgi:hypothetical protein